MEINSSANERVKQWAKLHLKKVRDEMKLFLVEGEHLIEEALKAECVEHLLIIKGKTNPFSFEAIECSEEVINKLSENVSKAWIIAVCRQQEYPIEQRQRVVLLDGVQDPGNVGTILRTALSFGYQQVILSPNCADCYNEKCVRSTQGAIFHLSVVRAELKQQIRQLKSEGFQCTATALQDACALSELQFEEKRALIFGNEGQGISQEILALTDQLAFIEMSSFESLNVAVAAGICLYHTRQKKQ